MTVKQSLKNILQVIIVPFYALLWVFVLLAMFVSMPISGLLTGNFFAFGTTYFIPFMDKVTDFVVSLGRCEIS